MTSSPLVDKASASSRRYATFAAVSPSARTTHVTASWWSRLLFGYARELLDVGATRQLATDDLWQLEGPTRTRVAYALYKAAYERHDHSVVKAMAAAFGWQFLICGVGSVVMAACSIFAPAVLHQVIDAFNQPELDMEKLAPWIVAFFASRLVNSFTEAHVNFRLELVLMQLTVSLKSMIFEKAMRRSLQSKNENDMVDVSNLFTADVQTILWAGYSVNTVWIMPIQITVVLYMLYNVLDVAAFAGLGVIFVTMGLNYLIAKGYIQSYVAVMQFKDIRMKAIKEVFGAIQIVKLNAWEHKVGARIAEMRRQEIIAIARYLYMVALSIFLFWSSPLFVSAASFATYALVLEKELTAAKVFTAMVLFNSIREPLSQFPDALQMILQARIALGRVAVYLHADEVDPNRVARDAQEYADDIELSVEHATFRWGKPVGTSASEGDRDPLMEATTPETPPLLRDVNVQIRKGDFVVVHGAVGAGKSSLCAALLGELPCEEGKVFVRSQSIAYYSQQPWIQNMSIRDNILFGLPYDKTTYERVLDVCGLVKDIAMFPAGDATEIGQKGVNLSGGQKARVGLARACYADADVYVLDSPLAAVDAIVQLEIFNKCLCGLLENKTIVLVTHLHDIIASDVANVKVLIEGGEAHVTYGKHTKPRREYATLETNTGDDTNPGVNEVLDDGGHSGITAPAGSLVGEEQRAVGRVSATVVKAYFQAIGGYPVVALFVVILALWQSFQVASDLWLSQWTGSRSSASITAASVEYNVGVYSLLGLGAAVFVLMRALLLAHVGIVASRYLFNEMTTSLLNAPLRFFDANPIGRIINRYAEDISTIDFRMPFAIFGLLVSLAINSFQLLTAIYVIRFAGILILPLGWLYVSVSAFYLRTSREVTRLLKTSTSPILSHVAQSEDGVAVLRAFGDAYIERAVDINFQTNDANNRVWYAETSVNQWFTIRVQMVGFGVVVVVVSTLLVLHAYLSPGLVGVAFMYAVNVDQELSIMVRKWTYLEVTLVSPERILEYIGIPPEGHTSQLTSLPEEWPHRGGIRLENVQFAYKPGGDLVLKGLSFEIRHNEKVGIVGRTGAGKSSLTMAIFRINELVAGRIVLDGVDISTVNLQTLRSRMSIIPQVPVLFKGPLRAYMDPFGEYNDASIWEAFEKIDMKTMISALDGKLEHELSENGENFSVGERQLLCLARALLRKSRVVIMDEATASIDVKTEQRLQHMIKREFVDATVLTIAHRLATVLESDRILVLSDGRVVEFDTPQQLAQIESGVFRTLAKESGHLPQLL